MNTFVGVHDGSGRRVAVVAARFNEVVTAKLVEGAVTGLAKHGVDEGSIDVAWVPGAFEIPHAARVLAESGRYDAVAALGVVIRGATPHFEYVCRSVTDGVREVTRDTGVPVAFGVLTVDDAEQALARAGGSEGNKGSEAALAAIEMARLSPKLRRPPSAPTRRGRAPRTRRPR